MEESRDMLDFERRLVTFGGPLNRERRSAYGWGLLRG